MNTEQFLNLKNLVQYIFANKEAEANLCLDEGCILDTDDPKPLVKIINYLINYLDQLTDRPLEVGLDLLQDGYLLTVMAFTEKTELPAVSDQIAPALEPFNAQLDTVSEAGSHVQFKLMFRKATA
jgi:hypothetical protein